MTKRRALCRPIIVLSVLTILFQPAVNLTEELDAIESTSGRVHFCLTFSVSTPMCH
jgi:hypothetical protein